MRIEDKRYICRKSNNDTHPAESIDKLHPPPLELNFERIGKKAAAHKGLFSVNFAEQRYYYGYSKNNNKKCNHDLYNFGL